MKICYRCGSEWTELRQPGFNEVCEDCHSYWHSCMNCALHAPGMHNECRSPTTEMVADREKGNVCEEFVFRNPDDDRGRPGDQSEKKDPRQQWDDLFSQ